MKKLLFKMFGYKWKYAFANMNTPRFDFRICQRTGKAQYLYTDSIINDGKPFWMTAIMYTDRGAKEHHPKNLLI